MGLRPTQGDENHYRGTEIRRDFMQSNLRVLRASVVNDFRRSEVEGCR